MRKWWRWKQRALMEGKKDSGIDFVKNEIWTRLIVSI